MKPIRLALWGLLAVLTGVWLLADTLRPQPFNYFAFRGVAVQLTGVLAVGAMAVALVLAVRPRWLEPHLHGLDKMYRLHKWLGITALITGVAHWWLAKGTKWMVGWGWLERPQRGPRAAVEDPLQAWLTSQRGLAESLGEWAFYAAAALLVLALIKRFPYRWFAKTHTLLALAFLVLAYHSIILLKFSYWAQPVGWLTAALVLAGSAAALWVLAGRVGAVRKRPGQIVETQYFAPLRVLRTVVSVPQGWPDHQPGQFAFVTSHKAEGAHPYTMASAWDPAKREITFITKALGDHTATLPDVLRPGMAITVEGPYGCFTFDDDASRQIWVGAGIGITPFIARMQQLARERAAQPNAPAVPVDLFHSTREEDPEALALMQADAQAAGIHLHVLVDARDGFLNAERIRAAVPDWQQASVWFCGPTGFGSSLRTQLTAQGLPARRFHQELFEMR